MRTFGLTGGIACGKSTVAQLLAELGVPVVDADALARVVVEPGQPAWDEIRREFGPEVFTADGQIDRKKLGALVFGQPQAKKRLEQITHPRIMEEARKRLANLVAQGQKLAVYEAALLVETGAFHWLDGLIVVTATEAQQLERLRLRDGLAEEDARKRITAQLPISEKAQHATHVINNSGTLEATRKQVQLLVASLTSA